MAAIGPKGTKVQFAVILREPIRPGLAKDVDVVFGHGCAVGTKQFATVFGTRLKKQRVFERH